MSLTSNNPENPSALLKRFISVQRVWFTSLFILLLLSVLSTEQAVQSGQFALAAIVNIAPYLLFSIGVAAYANASGADNLIARAFTGAPAIMILFGAVAGGLSPFCSCGVIPLIAALLTMGVPLSAVMAFWLASPIMDPSMFFLTSGVLGLEFAIAKTLAAIGLGLFGGTVVHSFSRGGTLSDPLRDGVGNGGCGGSKVRVSKPVAWRFWFEEDRRRKFTTTAMDTTLFLAKWLLLAFIIESLMLAWVPAETVSQALGGTGLGPIAIATLVGVPAYLNGYAALPLVGGLIEQGMSPGAGMAFLIAGGVTSIPAAMAVWALAKPHVFSLYIGLSLSGAFAAGLLFQLWQTT